MAAAAAFCLLLAAAALSSTGTASGFFGGKTGEFTEDFEGPARRPALLLHGAGTVADDGGGRALRVGDGTRAELAAPRWLTGRGGTVSFRVKPLWKRDDDRSRTFLTLRWNDGRDGYLALSQGWWEPQGSGRLYFILNNQEYVNCNLTHRLEPGVWSTVTAVWKDGDEGYCRVFLDGVQVAESRKGFRGDWRPAGPLHLGSDSGATDRRERGAGFLMDDLVILDRPLSAREALTLHEERDADAAAEQKERGWIAGLIGTKGEDCPPRERRVMFDEDIRWATSREATDRIVARLKESGFNVYVPCVWHGRGTSYPTSLAHQDERVARRIASGHDPLAYLIERAHREGIEVHPWFTVVRREDDRFPGLFEKGTPKEAYDVHNERFRRFIVELMVDLVRRYPVDGVNLDYIRSMGFCEGEQCKAEYRSRFDRSLSTDLLLRKLPGGGPDSLARWNGEAVTEIVRSFAREARAARPGIVISVDAHPGGPEWRLQGQDSVVWANTGLVDVIYAMDYRKRIDTEALGRARALLGEPGRLTPLLSTYDLVDAELVPRRERGRVTDQIGGKAVVARSPGLINDYVRLSRTLWPGCGVAFYHEKRLSDGQAKVLGAGAFRESVAPLWPVGR